MNRVLILCMFAFMMGCVKAPPAYVQPDGGIRTELPDAGDGGLPEAGDTGDTDAGEEE